MDTKRKTIGIDIGGVISDRLNDGDTAERDPNAFLAAPVVHGAVEAIAHLVKYCVGPHNVYLVSKCRWRMQLKTRRWLRSIDFYARTGVYPDNVWYCLERNEKADICKVLGITHFVDDRLEILGELKSVPSKVLFRPNPDEMSRFARHLPSVTRVENWGDALKNLQS